MYRVFIYEIMKIMADFSTSRLLNQEELRELISMGFADEARDRWDRLDLKRKRGGILMIHEITIWLFVT